MKGFLKILLIITMTLAVTLPSYAETEKATITFEYYIDGDATPFTTSKLDVDFDPVRDTIEYTVKAPKFIYKDSGGMGSGITDGLITSLDGPPIDQASVYKFTLTKRRIISGLGQITIYRDNPVRVIAIKYENVVQEKEINIGENPSGKDDRSFIVKSIVWTCNSFSDGLNDMLIQSGLSLDSVIYSRDVYVVDANGQSKLMKSPVAMQLSPESAFGAVVLFFWPIGVNVGSTILYCMALWSLIQINFASSADIRRLAKARLWSALTAMFLMVFGLKIFRALLMIRDTLMQALTNHQTYSLVTALKEVSHAADSNIFDAVLYLIGVLMQLVWATLYLGQSLVASVLIIMIPSIAAVSIISDRKNALSTSLHLLIGQIMTPIIDGILMYFMYLFVATGCNNLLITMIMASILGVRSVIRQALGIGGGMAEMAGVGFLGLAAKIGMRMGGKALGASWRAMSRNSAKMGGDEGADVSNNSTGNGDTVAGSTGYQSSPESDFKSDINSTMTPLDEAKLEKRRRQRAHMYTANVARTMAPAMGVAGQAMGAVTMSSFGPLAMGVGAAVGRQAGYGLGMMGSRVAGHAASGVIGHAGEMVSKARAGINPMAPDPGENPEVKAKRAVMESYATINQGKAPDMLGLRTTHKETMDSLAKDAFYSKLQPSGITKAAEVRAELKKQQKVTMLTANRAYQEGSLQGQVDQHYADNFRPQLEQAYIDRAYALNVLKSVPADIRSNVATAPEVMEESQQLKFLKNNDLISNKELMAQLNATKEG